MGLVRFLIRIKVMCWIPRNLAVPNVTKRLRMSNPFTASQVQILLAQHNRVVEVPWIRTYRRLCHCYQFWHKEHIFLNENCEELRLYSAVWGALQSSSLLSFLLFSVPGDPLALSSVLALNSYLEEWSIVIILNSILFWV